MWGNGTFLLWDGSEHWYTHFEKQFDMSFSMYIHEHTPKARSSISEYLPQRKVLCSKKPENHTKVQ